MYEKKVFELNSQRDSNISSIKQLRDELTNLQDTSRYIHLFVLYSFKTDQMIFGVPLVYPLLLCPFFYFLIPLMLHLNALTALMVHRKIDQDLLLFTIHTSDQNILDIYQNILIVFKNTCSYVDVSIIFSVIYGKFELNIIKVYFCLHKIQSSPWHFISILQFIIDRFFQFQRNFMQYSLK